MPIYEFKCPQCGTEKEVFIRSINEKADGECPVCHSEMEKKFSLFTAIYKGPGFATTEARGITGRKRKPNIKVGKVSDLPPEEREKYIGQIISIRMWFKAVTCFVCNSDDNIGSYVFMVGVHQFNSCYNCNVWDKLL